MVERYSLVSCLPCEDVARDSCLVSYLPCEDLARDSSDEDGYGKDEEEDEDETEAVAVQPVRDRDTLIDKYHVSFRLTEALVLLYCWLGLLTCKTVSQITCTVLLETLCSAHSLTEALV